MARRITILEGYLEFDPDLDDGVYTVGPDIVDVYLSELQGSHVIVTITSDDADD
jgi:hypothetical protein